MNLRTLGPEWRVKPTHPFHPAAHGRNPLILLPLRRSKNRTQLPIVRLGCRRGLRADCGTLATATRPGLRMQPRKPRCTNFPQSSSHSSLRPAPTWRRRRRGRDQARSRSRRSSGEQLSKQQRSQGMQTGRTGEQPPCWSAVNPALVVHLTTPQRKDIPRRLAAFTSMWRTIGARTPPLAMRAQPRTMPPNTTRGSIAP